MAKIRAEDIPIKQRRNNNLTRAILDGMTLEDAAANNGFNSRQAAQNAFRLTVVKFFTTSYHDEIKSNRYDIKYLRKMWNESKTIKI